MTASDLGSGLLLFGLMAVATAIEGVVPLHPRSPENTRHLRINLPLTAMTSVVYALLFGAVLCAAAATRSAGIGLTQWVGSGPLADGFLTLAGLDLATYLAHRSMHASPFLWRFHRVHHIDSAVDATTAFRQHPLETVYRAFALGLAAALLGAPAEMIVLYRTLSAINAVFEHANLRVPRRVDAFFALGVVTPHMHKIHHSRVRPETNSNYGNLLSGFDRLFRTFVPTARAFEVEYGLDGHDSDATRTLTGILCLPLFESPSADLGSRV